MGQNADHLPYVIRGVPWRTSLQVVERLTGSDMRLLLLKDGEHTCPGARI